MNQPTVAASPSLPALFAPTPEASERFAEFFTAQIRNRHTRRAYLRTAREFAAWCERAGIDSLAMVRPLHVATYIESLGEHLAAPSVKQQLAALRHLFDWLVTGQQLPSNPAAAVRGPRYSVKTGKTPVLTASEARMLLDSIETETPIDLRDRALISLMIYTFARIGAAVQMRVEDVAVQGRRLWVNLKEKGGKQHRMPCHHRLEEVMEAYLEKTGLAMKPKTWLFPTAPGRTGVLSDRPLQQHEVHRMIRRRIAAVGIDTKVGCHSFRAAGITEYLRNGGKLEIAQQMANHESSRTTGLYDRRHEQIDLDEIERIVL
jgi:site-specific recombinase XerD